MPKNKMNEAPLSGLGIKEGGLVKSIGDARDSGLYDISEEPGFEWVMPKLEYTYYDAEQGFDERPSFVRCLNCDKVIRYALGRWSSWSFRHGEMCRA